MNEEMQSTANGYNPDYVEERRCNGIVISEHTTQFLTEAMGELKQQVLWFEDILTDIAQELEWRKNKELLRIASTARLLYLCRTGTYYSIYRTNGTINSRAVAVFQQCLRDASN